MSHLHLPSGLKHGLPFLIPEDWTAEQALAVFELLDDLRDVIWQRYQIPIQSLLDEQRRAEPISTTTENHTDQAPF
jgi:hypothetical protein